MIYQHSCFIRKPWSDIIQAIHYSNGVNIGSVAVWSYGAYYYWTLKTRECEWWDWSLNYRRCDQWSGREALIKSSNACCTNTGILIRLEFGQETCSRLWKPWQDPIMRFSYGVPCTRAHEDFAEGMSLTEHRAQSDFRKVRKNSGRGGEGSEFTSGWHCESWSAG